MGRVNVKYFIYALKKKIFNFMPYKFKKPILLVLSITMLIGYYNFLIKVCSMALGYQNPYLKFFKSMITNFNKVLQSIIGLGGESLFIFFLLICMLYLYTRPIVKKEDRIPGEYYSKSYYCIINSIIGALYILFTILAFLPLFVK